jgi:diguanylate cyclase (GGDEF)-like protein
MLAATAPLHGSLAASMERVAGLAATALRAPVAFIMLVGDDRRCFAAGPRIPAWCAHDPGALRRLGIVDLVAEATAPVVIPDLRTGVPPELTESAAQLEIAGFVGAPLRSSTGECLGVFCAADTVVTSWTPEEVDILSGLASIAASDLDLRQTLADHEAAERRLRHDALHDGLTGLANRASFTDRLRNAVERPRLFDLSQPAEVEPPKPTLVEEEQAAPTELVAVLFLDLNDFRGINERIGHHLGDQLLIAVGRRLEEVAGPSAFVARLGGDEFAILLERIEDPDVAQEMAERLRAAFAEPMSIGGQVVTVTMSIGIAMSATAADIPEHLLRSADLAMTRAKHDARTKPNSAGPVIFDWRISAEARARRRLEGELRNAVRSGELLLHYLPTVHLATGKISGVEALLRWNHPARGLVLPGEFLGIAEELELMHEIDRWVLREACRQVMEWGSTLALKKPLSVSVNLSVRQFSSVAFIEEVARTIWETGMDPECLSVEVNEKVVTRDVARAAGTLVALRTLGIKVMLDDFGTGSSSLSALQRLPLDGIKIDHTFVSRMDRDEQAMRVVRTVAGLARDLGLTSVAEGVSAGEHLKILQELGCSHGQGPLFSTAVDASGVVRLLKAGRPW